MSTSTEIKIEMPHGVAPVYCLYDGQCQPQPAYIRINENGSVYAEYSGDIGGGCAASIWHNRDRAITIRPGTSGNALRELFADEGFLSLVRRYYDGFDTEWDGSNWVGVGNDDCRAALEEIEQLAEALDCVNLFDARDWVEYTSRAELNQYGGYEGYAKHLNDMADSDQVVIGGADAIEKELREMYPEEEIDA